MRKLASIQKIVNIDKIENADNIEIAQVLGWQLVVKKNEFQVGDLCVYCEIDSVMPERDEFEFLRPRNFRIKTIKLRGKISQGIAFPLSILPNGDYHEGEDVTELLGVRKYEPPVIFKMGGDVKGAFPGFLIKTDQTRIQSVPGVLERNRGKRFFVTEKLDGTSGTFYFNNGEFGVCSRNLEMKDSEQSLYWKIARGYDLCNKLSTLKRNLAIQGEIVGPKIQNNRYQLSRHQLFIFDIFDIDKYRYFSYGKFLELVNVLELEAVPVLEEDWVLLSMVDEMVEFASRESVLNLKIKNEGIVVKSIEEDVDEELGRLSFKVVNPEYLLKYGE